MMKFKNNPNIARLSIKTFNSKMKETIVSYPLVLLAIVLAALLAPAPRVLAADKIKIVLVGDSTVTDKSGWGLGFKQFLNDGAECINLARGGRSSLSYMREGRWTNALAMRGDYYLIQFGHNNEPGKPGRSTDMATFVANMNQYVDDARAAGAQPILVTPLTRRQWDKEHPGKIKSSLAPYADEVRKIAEEKHVPLVDLQARSIELCESLGPEKCLEFSPMKNDAGRQVYDATHLNTMGSVMFARLVVEELRKAVPDLAPVLRASVSGINPVLQTRVFDEIVTPDGAGDAVTIQEALKRVPDHRGSPWRILVEPGLYHGQFMVPAALDHVWLVGVDAASTILNYHLNVNEAPPGETYQFNPGLVVAGNDFLAENLTIENDSGDHGQALALRVDGDREVFRNCRITGWQDTLMMNNGRDYLTNCYVAGRVDFIYGSATALLDQCEIHSRNGGHVTAASTPENQPYGFVFIKCKLTGDDKPWVDSKGHTANQRKTPIADLGRPWRPHASVAYLDCWMGSHIAPAGWNNWGKVQNESTARYAEYDSTGPGANPQARVVWAHELTAEQAKSYTVENILGGQDHWNPAEE